MKEAEIRSGDWIDPEPGQILFGDYADAWISDHVFKPRTVELYRGLLKNHLRPTFGDVEIAAIRDADSAVAKGTPRRRPGKRPFGLSLSPRHTGCCTGSWPRLSKRTGISAVIRAGSRAPGKNTRLSGRVISGFVVLVELLETFRPGIGPLLLATFANLRFGELAGS